MSSRISRKFAVILLGAVMATAAGAGGMYYAMSSHHGMMGDHASGLQHDEVNMPGLRGENATPEETAELAVMFRNFDTITRDVENLPNGIRTVTRSSDQKVMDALVNHSVGMIDRVGRLDDPQIMIQSPTLDIFFLRGQEISSEVSVEDAGLVVVQTSDNAEVVAALQTHAAEVTAMADRGMQAVHEMMAAEGRTHGH